ncbi:hypothetical protein RI054_13g64730 [Pseudoscourfieldia marina]
MTLLILAALLLVLLSSSQAVSYAYAASSDVDDNLAVARLTSHDDVARWHVVVTWSRGKQATPGYEEKDKTRDEHGQAPARDISFVNGFPEEEFNVTLYAKGVKCSELPDKMRKVTCVELPNYSGREAHTILHHLAEYHRLQHEHDTRKGAGAGGDGKKDWLPLPTATIFLQDDSHLFTSPGNTKESVAGSIVQAMRENLPKQPGARLNNCFCQLARETFFAGYQYKAPMRFLAKRVLDIELPEDDGKLMWTNGAEFAIDAVGIRNVSVRAMKRLMPYLTSDAEDHSANGMPKNLTPAMQKVCDTQGICISPLRYAHCMERMWHTFLRLPRCGYLKGHGTESCN